MFVKNREERRGKSRETVVGTEEGRNLRSITVLVDFKS
jgi:hypothetical protein